MLDTVQFDMGGTLEDIWYNEETAERAARGLLDLLKQHGLTVSCGQSVFWEQVQQGVSRYKFGRCIIWPVWDCQMKKWEKLPRNWQISGK